MGTELVLANTLCSKVTLISISTLIQCRGIITGSQVGLTSATKHFEAHNANFFLNTSPQTRSSGLKMTPPTQGAGAFAGVEKKKSVKTIITKFPSRGFNEKS